MPAACTENVAINAFPAFQTVVATQAVKFVILNGALDNIVAEGRAHQKPGDLS